MLSHPAFQASGRVNRPEAFASQPVPKPSVAVLLTGCTDVDETVRAYATLLPGARIVVDAESVTPVAGATLRRGPIRRMLAGLDADVFILARGPGIGDACAAPQMVAAVATGGHDFVGLARIGGAPEGDLGERLLSGAMGALFGRGGDALSSNVTALSRRFAVSFAASGSARPTEFDLALHALRLRLPMGRVAALAEPRRRATRARGVAGWLALLRLLACLFVEERPRRVLGIAGLLAMAAGLAVAAPGIAVGRGWATLPPSPAGALALVLLTLGAATGLVGLWLDAVTSARQEVARLGVEAIPRRS